MKSFSSIIIIALSFVVCFNCNPQTNYVPKSFYIIDENGIKSNTFYIRNKRDILPILTRFKRGNSYSNSGSFSGGIPSDFGADFLNPEEFAKNFPPQFFNGDGKGGASAFASSSSSGNGYGSGFGSGTNGHASGPGPQLFSRFGEGQGSGVHVSGHASGPRGAFSQTSSSVDETGKIKYSVQSGKY